MEKKKKSLYKRAWEHNDYNQMTEFINLVCDSWL